MNKQAIINIAQASFEDVDISAITSDDDFAKGEYHQAILNVGYGEWQRRTGLIRCDITHYDKVKDERVNVFSGTKDQCHQWLDENKDEYDDLNMKAQDTEKNAELNWGYSDMVKWMRVTYGSWFAMMILLGKYNQQVCNGGHIQYLDNGYASVSMRGWGGADDIGLHQNMENYFKNFWLKELPHGEEIFEIMEDFRPEFKRDFAEGDEIAEDEFYGQFDGLDNRYYKIQEEWMDQLNKYAKSVMSG